MKNLKIYKRLAAFVLTTTQLITMSGCSNQTSNGGSTSAPTAITTTTENQTTTTPSSQITTIIPARPTATQPDISISKNGVTVYNSDFEIEKQLEKEINNNIKSFDGDCSFIAINLKDGMSFCYNVDKKHWAADAIYLPFALYCCKQMDAGNGSLDELKVYEEKFRLAEVVGGLADRESGVEYSIKRLLKFTIINNDTTAYFLLHDRFYDNSYNDYLKKLGCNNLYLEDGATGGYIDAKSMALVLQEIYKYKDESPNGKYLFELLMHSKYNFIKEGMDDYDSVHNFGWEMGIAHDLGIVFAEDDYIVVILNSATGYSEPESQLLKISSNIEEVINEYTLYKQKTKEKQKTLTK